jgi:cation:H+ antiporter
MLLHFIFIAVGFAILIKGADVLIEGACSLAKRFKVPDLIVGLTIVAFGTSAPELAVSVISAVKGSGGIAIGNVMGSNIANLCLVLGVAGIIAPIAISRTTIRKDLMVCVGTAVLLLIMVVLNQSQHMISRLEAIILLIGLCAYMVFMFTAKREPVEVPDEDASYKPGMAIFLVLLGLICLPLGGQLIVKSSVAIAEQLGVSEALIGLTIIALGTSLPELATSILAVMKKKSDIAVGNVLGSNIMNTCLVLGTAAAVKPIDAVKSFTVDAAIAVAAPLLLLVFMYTGKKNKLDRWEAAILLTSYIAYIGFVICRK